MVGQVLVPHSRAFFFFYKNPAFPLLFHENPASRSLLTKIPHYCSFFHKNPAFPLFFHENPSSCRDFSSLSKDNKCIDILYLQVFFKVPAEKKITFLSQYDERARYDNRHLWFFSEDVTLSNSTNPVIC